MIPVRLLHNIRHVLPTKRYLYPLLL